MVPVRLRLVNFLSFKELEYDFENGPVLLMGENRSDEGQESNGSGKTAIQSAIEKCWLDYTSRKGVRDVDLIRRGQDEAAIESWVYCPVRDEVFHIKRTLTRKGNKLELYVNDEPVSFATVNDGNNYIIDWFGISKEDLSNYYVVNKERFVSFFTSSNSQKLQLIARFSNATFLDNVDSDIKMEVSSKETARESLVREKAFVQGRIETLKESLAGCSIDKYERMKEEEISSYRNRIMEKESEIALNEEKIDALILEMGGIERGLVMVNDKLKEQSSFLSSRVKEGDKISKEIDSINNALKEVGNGEKQVRDDIKESIGTKSEIEEALADIDAVLAGIITCPKCGHRFLFDEDADIKVEEEKKVDLIKLNEEINSSIVLLNDDLCRIEEQSERLRGDLRSKREEESRFTSELSVLRKNLAKVEEDIERDKLKLETYKKQVKSLESDIEREKAEAEKLSEKIDEVSKEDTGSAFMEERGGIESGLEKENGKLKELDQKIEIIDGELQNAREWLVQYKEFRMYLANVSVKEIQRNCNETLRDMGSDLLVNMDGFKRKADGTVKEEITPTILRDEPLPFNSFSGGERGRLEYAMILAQQRMINQSNEHGGLNFLFTDEIAEGIDALGLRSLVKSLDRFNYPILVTTHVVNQSVGTKVLKVIKENNISRIE